MEKDIGKITKGADTDIVIRIDDFGGKVGLTIREFVKSERYTGFTKAGTRIPADKFKEFKDIINSIDESELASAQQEAQSKLPQDANKKSPVKKKAQEPAPEDEEIQEGGLDEEMATGED